MKKINRYVNVNKKINFIKKTILFVYISLFLYISSFMILNNNYYNEKLITATNSIYSLKDAPRGRIYDRNYKLLVDNKIIPNIYYYNFEKDNSITQAKYAYKIAEIFDFDLSKLTDKMLKDYYLVFDDCNSLITEEEWDKYYYGDISSKDIYKYKLERIDNTIFDNYSDLDKKSAYVYYLMNNGYSYEKKIIKDKNISDNELAKFIEEVDSSTGFYVDYSYEREYLYGDTLRNIFGNVSMIPIDEKEYYLSNGYSVSDLVGTSYLEKEYEEYLKGEKGSYDISNNSISEYSKRGKDIVLTIDIDLQIKIDEIIKEELINAKKEPNTSLFNSAYVVVKDPKTGEILAMSGKILRKENNEYQIYDDSIGVLTKSMTPGSVVKGASMLVGYKENAIKIGEVFSDNCIKMYSYPKKCSWKYLGNVDDIRALSLSSNVFQFRTAFKVANFDYSYNKKITNVSEAFNKYRTFFKEIGLGGTSGIDLPVDGVGNIGKSNSPDLYLNYVIGQYDTYTTMQLSEYISTIANNGKRVFPHLLLEVRNNDNDDIGSLYYKFNPINKELDIDKKYIERVKLGFEEVMKTGLGRNFMGNVLNPAGKTGTSESFYDSNGDGIIDTPTVSNAFVGYFPSDNPKVSIALTFPNIIVVNDTSGRSYANKKITKRVAEIVNESLKK